MIKDTFFSLNRFMDLCRKDMVENWKSNLLFILLMYGALLIVPSWNAYFAYQYPSDSHDNVVPFAATAFVWLCWIFGCLAASITMVKMKSKKSRLSILMLPATSFEKFFSRWIVYTIVYLTVFILVYLLADYTRVFIYSIKYPDLIIEPAHLKYIFTAGSEYYYMTNDINDIINFIFAYFFFQSCFVLGSSVWPKNSFIKTFAAGFVIMMSYSLLGAGMLKLLVGQSNVVGPYVSQDTAFLVIRIFAAFLILMNWTLAYYRFKESEIINRC